MLTKLNNNPFYDVALGGDMATVLALFLYWKSMLQTTAVPAPDPKCSIICKKQQWNPVVPSPDPLWPMVASKILSINVMNRTSEKCTCTGNRSDLLLAMWIKLLLWSYRNQAALSRGPLTPSSSHRMPWRTWLNTISMSIKCGLVGQTIKHPVVTLDPVWCSTTMMKTAVFLLNSKFNYWTIDSSPLLPWNGLFQGG